MELNHADYDQVLGYFPVPILREICLKIPGFEKISPSVNDPAKFAESLSRIQTRSALDSLLKSLEEPSAEELQAIIQLLRSLASTAKRTLAGAAKRIQPVGGPKELLGDPVRIREIFDEICDAEKTGGSLAATAKKDIAKREKVSMKTLRRALKSERERRASLKPPPREG